jgi:hypothetical protein
MENGYAGKSGRYTTQHSWTICTLSVSELCDLENNLNPSFGLL